MLERRSGAFGIREEMREKHADQENVSRECATPLTNHLYVRPCSGETLVAVLAVTTSHRALATE